MLRRNRSPPVISCWSWHSLPLSSRSPDSWEPRAHRESGKALLYTGHRSVAVKTQSGCWVCCDLVAARGSLSVPIHVQRVGEFTLDYNSAKHSHETRNHDRLDGPSEVGGSGEMVSSAVSRSRRCLDLDLPMAGRNRDLHLPWRWLAPEIARLDSFHYCIACHRHKTTWFRC